LADMRSTLAATPGTAAAGGRAAFPVAVVVGAMAATAANEASARPRASHAAAALVLGRQQHVESWRQSGLTDAHRVNDAMVRDLPPVVQGERGAPDVVDLEHAATPTLRRGMSRLMHANHVCDRHVRLMP